VKQPPLSSPNARLQTYIPLVQEFAARVVFFHESLAQAAGLHATDVKALRLLGNESLAAGRLAELTGLTGASTTALVDRLEAAGYVVRERDGADRRKVTIRAVPSRVREIDRLYADHAAEISQLLDYYSPTEFAAIMDYLKRASRILEDGSSRLRKRR
jgi:DNA-binding MarR family transcriptional regulator